MKTVKTKKCKSKKFHPVPSRLLKALGFSRLPDDEHGFKAGDWFNPAMFPQKDRAIGLYYSPRIHSIERFVKNVVGCILRVGEKDCNTDATLRNILTGKHW